MKNLPDTVEDFVEPDNVIPFKALLYDWNQGVDVVDDIEKLLKPGYDIDDLHNYLDAQDDLDH